MSTIPLSVAEGRRDEPLATFSGDPALAFEGLGDDLWTAVDRALNPVIGYDVTAIEISYIIRRGFYGMDGLCSWLECCVERLGVDPCLLEGKIGRLLSAIGVLQVFHALLFRYLLILYKGKLHNPRQTPV
jgi:hypothetical protein